jgi:hypothetical protein
MAITFSKFYTTPLELSIRYNFDTHWFEVVILYYMLVHILFPHRQCNPDSANRICSRCLFWIKNINRLYVVVL